MIRLAEIKDVESIAKIITTAWKTAYKGIVDQKYAENLPNDKFVHIFTKNITERKEIIFVNQDKIVNGFISGSSSNEKYDCEIIGLYIHPEYQRQGIGTELVKTMIDYFRKEGKKNLIIWTLDGAPNNAFYERLGGVKKEYKELDIGDKKYQGVGFNIKI
jgi:GNAT superfamily N-acetyltransferase